MSQEPYKFRFEALHFSWAALHPQPQGVIFLIGGAFFGTFPTIFYRFLARSLFENGYTVVALPFRFSFRHWTIALSLVRYQVELRQELAEAARRRNYNANLYQEEPTSAGFNYLWIGHSLGCKYIALLELLSDLETESNQSIVKKCLGSDQQKSLLQALLNVDLKQNSLLNQPSILLDSVISDLDNAVPIKSLERLIHHFIRVQPSREETFCLVEESKLFNLTSILAFRSSLAQETVLKLKNLLADRLIVFKDLPIRRHLAALGWRNGNQELVQVLLEAIAASRQRFPLTETVLAVDKLD